MPDELYELMRCVPSTRHFTHEPVAPQARTRTRLRELYPPPWNAYVVKTASPGGCRR